MVRAMARHAKPTAAETEANPRARSARMRAAERTETPARQISGPKAGFGTKILDET